MTATGTDNISEIRGKFRTYTSAVLVGITTFVLLMVIPFLPSGYILPILLGFGLAILYLRETGLALVILYILTYFSIIWQLLGFGFFQLLDTSVGLVVILALVVPLLSYFIFHSDGISISLVILSVALMLTPVYFLSIPLVLLVTVFAGFGSARIQAINFVLLLTPLVILDNAIYYATTLTSASAAPIIFSQLGSIASNLRPPLSGVNLLQGGIPANYLYSHALSVSGFILARGYIVYIPLIIFGVVLVATVSIGNFLTNSLMKQISVVEITRNYSKILQPVVAFLITAVAFIVIMLGLSPLAANILQTSISTGAGPYYLIAGSLGLVGLLTGTELLTQRLERTEVARIRLEELLSALNSKISTISGEINEISTNASSIDVSSEEKTLAEYISYADDVKKQIPTAGLDSFVSWTSDIENRIFPSLDSMPDKLMRRLTSALQVLSSASLTTNSHLDESKAPGSRYPVVEEFPTTPETQFGEVIQIYQQTLNAIEQTTTELFDLYQDSVKAYNSLMVLDDVAPPVSPASLLVSKDYVTAMKLVSEDYWLNFHIRESERYNDKLSDFISAVTRIEDATNEEDRERLVRIIRTSKGTTPSSASLMTKNVVEAIDYLRDATGNGIEEIENVKKLVGTVDPTFSNVLKLNTTGILDEMLAVQNTLRGVKPNFYDVISASKDALPILKSYSEYRKMDEESLILISQYPIAVRLLRRLFAENKDIIRTIDLPFDRDTAAFFARSFAASNRHYSYDESHGELSYEHDKMYQRS